MRRLGLWHVAVLLAFTATGVLGQEYPNRAIRIVVPRATSSRRA